MIKENKIAIVKKITEIIKMNADFCLVDVAMLDALITSNLRKECYKQKIKLLVTKNTLLKKAFKQIEGDFSVLNSVLKGSTALMISDRINKPAKLIKNFPNGGNIIKLKAAYFQEDFYFGNESLDLLISIKSKNELICDIIFLLQSQLKLIISSINLSRKIIHDVLVSISQKKII